jgi:hypothetical protein
MPSFGYQAGDGTGVGVHVVVDAVLFSRFVNDTGDWVWIDTIDLEQVAVAQLTGAYQVGVYTDDPVGGFQPFTQLALSDVLTALPLGTSTFTLASEAPVAPDAAVWIGLKSSVAILTFDGVQATDRGRYAPASSFPIDYSPAYRRTNTVLPFVATGVSSTDPTGTQLRAALAGAEALREGASVMRAALAGAEALMEGGALLRLALVGVEALIHVPTEGEMATDLFPMGLGLSWETKKTPNFTTQVRSTTSLRTVRNSLTPYPAWDFEVSFVYLPSDAPFRSEGQPDLNEVLGFFLKMHGRHGAFLHRDPQDHQVVGGAQGVGDGVTTEFAFTRTMGGFAEPVGQLDVDAGWTIYVDGAEVDPVHLTFTAPNVFAFDVAPADAAVITADFDFFFVCHFLADAADFEQFNRDLFQLQQVQFRADPA